MIQIIIAILGLCGFWVARHIYKHKEKNVPLVCMVGFDCHTVVHSDYSRFFGIRVEILGMFYYFVVFLFNTILVFDRGFLSQIYSHLFSILSVIGFLFSVYLIAVQIFILKKGCSWCIVSAIISALIFFLTVFK